MKKVFVFISVTMLASFALAVKARKIAQESPLVINCSGQARNITFHDTVSMIRGNTGFNTGSLSIEINAEKSPIMSKGYNEELNQVTYEAPLVGTATAQDGKKKAFMNTCTVKFQADTCGVLSTACAGGNY